MTSRSSSGSRRLESIVEPTRSQKSTVSCRRSGCERSVTGGGADAERWSDAPHAPQKRNCGGFEKPQAEHTSCSATPDPDCGSALGDCFTPSLPPAGGAEDVSSLLNDTLP